jgi:predicted RNA-binding protein with RPS1 domain
LLCLAVDRFREYQSRICRVDHQSSQFPPQLVRATQSEGSMGGFAAKQRRRLERQSLQPPTEPENAKTARADASRKKHPRKPNKATVEPKSPKKKIQKPKHLKRKLEAIESGGMALSEAEQERLRHQMEEFELIKKRQKKGEVARERSDQGKSHATFDSSNKKSRGSNQSNNAKQQQKPQEKSPRKIEIEPSTSLKESESRNANKKSRGSEQPNTPKQHQKPQETSSREMEIEPSTGLEESESRIANKKSRGSEQPNTARQHQKPQEKSPREIEIEPSTGLEESESRIGEGRVKSNDDEDNDDEVDLDINTSRQRGKRRRGRKDIPRSAMSASGVACSLDGMEDSIVSAKLDEMKPQSDSTEGGVLSNKEYITSVGKSADEIPTSDSLKVRRCIGRKPVTDFKVGQCYSGKVVYAKPFGVFFDIGCHSDAFCHVSQLSDQFIESPMESFPVGQMIENSIRVVAIDRRKKRLTVSLQSPSSETNSEKLQKRTDPASISRDEVLPDKESRPVESGDVSSLVTAQRKRALASTLLAEELKNQSLEVKSMNDFSSAEQLKRARKIARRAERRAESAQ